MITRETIASYAYQYEGNWSRIARAAARKEKAYGYRIREPYITVLDEEYPQELRKLRFPPWVLFYEGDISLLKKPKVSIIGSRRLTPYGYRLTAMCAEAMCRNNVLVSGLAAGADGCVHRKAAACGGHSIGVVGSGLSCSYPAENADLYETMRRNDLILSEYPYNTGVRKYHFPWRNRIIAALGDFLIVTQAAVRSGTSLTVSEAMTLGKDVWCFPHPFDDESGAGCNKLIAEGALMLYDTGQLKVLASADRHS